MAKKQLLDDGEGAYPTCPYCGMEPMAYRTGTTVSSDNFVLFYVMCANRACRRLLPMVPVGKSRPTIAGIEGIAGLVMPN